MIQEVVNQKNSPAVTSDHWHVVHAKWAGTTPEDSRFVRSIVSEHENRDSAARAARGFVASLKPTIADRPASGRDQVFVRRPDFKSLKSTSKRVPKRKK